MGGATPTPPIVPRMVPGKPLTLLDIQPLELARQLTIIEANLFVKIKPPEFLNKKWQKDDAETTAPNIGAVISTANALASLIQRTILGQTDVKQRAAMVKHLVRTGMECKDLNNFSSMAAVVAGLAASAIQRLRKTWDAQSDKTMKDFALLESNMSSTRNFQRHKEMLKTINPPCVPFLGFYLSMLVFIEDGNRDFVPAPIIDANGNVVPMARTASMTSSMTRVASSASAFDGAPSGRLPLVPSSSATSTALATNGTITPSNSSTLVASTSSVSTNGGDKERPMLINFFKRGLTAEILRDVQQYQAQPYNLALCKPVMDWLKEGLAHPRETADELYALSLKIEPKERIQMISDEHRRGKMIGMGSLAGGNGMGAIL